MFQPDYSVEDSAPRDCLSALEEDLSAICFPDRYHILDQKYTHKI